MKQYLQLAEHILLNGKKREDRTGTGTLSVFGAQVRYDLSEGFPLMTTKDMMAPYPNGNTALDSIIYELLWFLNGDTNLKYLNDHGVNIWNPDGYRWFKQRYPDSDIDRKEFNRRMKSKPTGIETYEHFKSIAGDLGRIYGAQWRSWVTPDFDTSEEYPRKKTIDQIENVIESIRRDPFGRRHIVTAWNPGEIHKMALPPCHVLFQFYVDTDWKLSCQLYQRSADMFLGVPFNIASYALLTMMVADQCGLGYGEFIHTCGDAHIYLNHVEQMTEQIQREPKPLPKMHINLAPSIFEYKREDFVLTGYEAHPAIKGDVSVGL